VVETVREGSAAARAGLLAGDRVEAVDGEPLPRRVALPYRGSIGTLGVVRDGKPVTLQVGAQDRQAVADFVSGIAFRAPTRPFVDPTSVAFAGGESPAAEAGLRPGDLVEAVNGEPVETFSELAARVRGSDGPVRLKVRSGESAPREVTVEPRAVAAAPGARWEEVPYRTTIGGDGLGSALALGAQRTAREFRNVFRMIRSFATGDISVERGIGGPGTIVAFSAQSYRIGFVYFLVFLAVISVSLAVLNILPVPVLDGGQLLFLVIEKLRGRPLKEATIAKAQLVGLFLLLALMAFALRNDFRLLL
jgi:regulator of sigma E protease